MPSPPENLLPLEIDVHNVKQLIASDADHLLLDCREPIENQFCQLAGTCLIPMNETPSRLSELEPHRQSRIIVYCHYGTRSLHVARWLREQGFPNVQNMTGGIDVWSQIIDPDIARY